MVGEPKGKAEHVVAVQEEERADGAVAWRIYWVYIKAMCGHLWTVVPLMFFVLFVQGLSNLGDWWLNKWYVFCLSHLPHHEKIKRRHSHKKTEFRTNFFTYYVSVII